MSGSFIHVSLDLVLRLMDTTTGRVPAANVVRFLRGQETLSAMNKGDGCFVFVNLGREDFLMRIEAAGYEAQEVPVSFSGVESGAVSLDVFLMPSENERRGGRVITLAGKLPKLSSIEAVSLSMPVCSISEFDSKQNIMTLFLPSRRIVMESVCYALVHESESTFEPFEVETEISAVSVRVKKPLEQEYAMNAPISRVVFGRVDAKGNYLLRVRDSGSELKYLIRYVVDGTEAFQEVDFHNLEGVKLKKPPKKAKPAPEEAEAPQSDGEAPSMTAGRE